MPAAYGMPRSAVVQRGQAPKRSAPSIPRPTASAGSSANRVSPKNPSSYLGHACAHDGTLGRAPAPQSRWGRSRIRSTCASRGGSPERVMAPRAVQDYQRGLLRGSGRESPRSARARPSPHQAAARPLTTSLLLACASGSWTVRVAGRPTALSGVPTRDPCCHVPFPCHLRQGPYRTQPSKRYRFPTGLARQRVGDERALGDIGAVARRGRRGSRATA